MTFSKKTVALVLLSSVAFGAHATQKKSCHRSKECPKSDCVDRSFQACLTFDQELVGAESPGTNDSRFVPRSESDAPDASGREVTGHIELCFNKDLSAMHYRLFVFDALGQENTNERITQAHLHAGRANENGDIIAFLFSSRTPASFACGQPVDGLLFEGTLTNSDIMNINDNGKEFNTIASVFDGCRRGQIYVNVHGGSKADCDPNGIGYEMGIIRGEVFTENTSG